MNAAYRVPDSHLIDPLTRNEPTEAEHAAVKASVLAHISANANVAHEVASDLLADGQPGTFGELWVIGDLLAAAMALKSSMDAKLDERASELADSFFVDDFTTHERQMLADWRPVRFRMSAERFLAEIMP